MSPSEPYCPDRGDFVWLELSPPRGHEQDGRRPALVLSPRAYNVRSGLCIVAPIASRPARYSFDNPVPEGLGVTGTVIGDQTSSRSWKGRNARFIAKAPQALVDDVAAKVKALLP